MLRRAAFAAGPTAVEAGDAAGTSAIRGETVDLRRRFIEEAF